MDILLFSFNAILPMLIPMTLGWFVVYRGHMKEPDKVFLNKLCFSYLMPFYIFNNTLSINYRAEFNPHLVVMCILGTLVAMLGAWIVFSLTIKDRARRCIFISSSFRSNNLIYALPLAANLFGETGIKTAVMLIPVSIIVFNIFSVIVMVYHAQDSKH